MKTAHTFTKPADPQYPDGWVRPIDGDIKQPGNELVGDGGSLI